MSIGDHFAAAHDVHTFQTTGKDYIIFPTSHDPDAGDVADGAGRYFEERIRGDCRRPRRRVADQFKAWELALFATGTFPARGYHRYNTVPAGGWNS